MSADSEPTPVVVQVTVTLTAVAHPESDAGGFSASVPALPGCYTEGETLDEVRVNLREAAEAWLASADDESRPGPWGSHPRQRNATPSGG